MLRSLRFIYIIVAIMPYTVSGTFGQRVDVNLTGLVYDSLTRLPLAYVTVINQTKNTGATTDENGSFKLNANTGDSILFTILGYSQARRIVGSNELAMMVFLREFAQTLNPVTIYGGFKPHGADKWKNEVQIPKVFRNPAGPGSGYAVETFGPGLSIGGLISKLSKSDKEKKKLNSIREKSSQSETFVSVIVSAETKSFFKETFSMSEHDYEEFIASFNKAHPEAVYLESKEDIMNLMVVFIATKK